MFASIIAFLYIVKQLLLDIAAMLVGNITVVLLDVIILMQSLAGMIWDIEALLEKLIVLLKS
jgi:hypothetical protein